MRAGFGLLSILVVAALIFYLTFGTRAHPGYDATVMEKGKTAREEAAQISGRTADNVPISETVQLDEVDSNGQFKRLKVVSVTPQTPLDTFYGLKAGDEITRIGEMGVADNNDAGLAKTLVYDAYRQNQNLTVLRNDQEITLVPKGSPMSKLGGIDKMIAPITGAGQAVPSH